MECFPEYSSLTSLKDEQPSACRFVSECLQFQGCQNVCCWSKLVFLVDEISIHSPLQSRVNPSKAQKPFPSLFACFLTLRNSGGGLKGRQETHSVSLQALQCYGAHFVNELGVEKDCVAPVVIFTTPMFWSKTMGLSPASSPMRRSSCLSFVTTYFW